MLLVGVCVFGASLVRHSDGAGAFFCAGRQGDCRFESASLGAPAADPIVTGAMPRTPFLFGILGSLEFKTPAGPYLDEWDRVSSAVLRERPLYAFCRVDPEDCSPALRKWRELLDTLRPLTQMEQVRGLNPAINGLAKYADDDVLYSEADHWATPLEFLSQGADCEDYAVIKFFSLLDLGFTPDQLRLVIARDEKRSVIHAFVAVILDQTYILDSLHDEPIEQRHLLRYRPLYSFNTEAQWAHIVTPQIRSRYLAQLEPNPTLRKGRVGLLESPGAPTQKTIVESTLIARPAVTGPAANVDVAGYERVTNYRFRTPERFNIQTRMAEIPTMSAIDQTNP